MGGKLFCLQLSFLACSPCKCSLDAFSHGKQKTSKLNCKQEASNCKQKIGEVKRGSLKGKEGGRMREKGCEQRGPKARSKNSDLGTPVI